MNFYLRLTGSKIAAYFVILCSAIYGFVYKDGTTMMAGFTLGIGILANKQYQDRKELEGGKHE
jgi:hypothetical protein